MMFRYVFNRIMIAIPMLFAISLLTFVLMRLTPGNFLDTMRMDPQYSEETIKRYEVMYKLDRPVTEQYLQWVKNLLQGELGFSFYYNVEVSRLISGRLWNTFILSFSSFLFTWAVAIPLGIWAAVNRGKWLDQGIQFFSYVFLSLPSFFIAMILLFWASQSNVLPLGGITSPNYEKLNWLEKGFDLAKHLVIPTIALSIGSIAALQKIMRGNLLETLEQKYILTARAKGLPERKVIYIHALRNAINPLITLLGYEFSGLLSGAALMEIICNWPGLGSLMLTAVRSKDIYLVMASMILGGVLFMIGNLLADIMLAKADPRIRLDGK